MELPELPDGPDVVQSEHSDVKAPLIFVNFCHRIVALYWINSAGAREWLINLNYGERMYVNSYEGHYYVAADLLTGRRLKTMYVPHGIKQPKELFKLVPMPITLNTMFSLFDISMNVIVSTLKANRTLDDTDLLPKLLKREVQKKQALLSS